ncbi:hypothetical protein C7212DRAFT_230934 [Tuber magnatum]|uniref:Tc1-like transposase DDE domain-containing protein n=1 Tax=Tuber magnatum TaxID=42249 RepID=A0A317SE38_9PEZI|nr:hypothetical protein C7212DRAFT_230934 [Tuber magnatum]
MLRDIKCTFLASLERFWHSESACTHHYVYIQEDNASPHQAHSTIADLQERSLYNYLLPWPATSPDINLIKPIWRLMKTRISKLIPCRQNNNDMIEAIQVQ